MIRKQYFKSKTPVRKIHQSLATFGTSAMFFLIPLANCDTTLFLIAIIASKFTYGLSTGGENAIPTDLSNEFAPTIFSISNMICTTAGFAPQIMGPLLDMNPAILKHMWWYIFAGIAILNILGGLIFLIWGSAEAQNWGKIDEERNKNNNGNEVNFT